MMPDALTDLPDPSQLEAMVALLESSGQYRVLRRVAPQPPLRRRVAVAEQLLEHNLRVVLHRQRRIRRLPRDGVAIRAAQAVAAVDARLFGHQLERRERCVLPDAPRY